MDNKGLLLRRAVPIKKVDDILYLANYSGTADANAGIWKYTAATDWVRLDSNARYYTQICCSADGKIVFAGTPAGIYRSVNGSAFTLISGSASVYILQNMLCSPDGNTLYFIRDGYLDIVKINNAITGNYAITTVVNQYVVDFGMDKNGTIYYIKRDSSRNLYRFENGVSSSILSPQDIPNYNSNYYQDFYHVKCSRDGTKVMVVWSEMNEQGYYANPSRLCMHDNKGINISEWKIHTLPNSYVTRGCYNNDGTKLFIQSYAPPNYNFLTFINHTYSSSYTVSPNEYVRMAYSINGVLYVAPVYTISPIAVQVVKLVNGATPPQTMTTSPLQVRAALCTTYN